MGCSPAVGEEGEHGQQQQDEHEDEGERQDERVQVWRARNRSGQRVCPKLSPNTPTLLPGASPLAVSSDAGSDQALQKPSKLGSAIRARTMKVYRVPRRRLLSTHSVRPSRISTWPRERTQARGADQSEERRTDSARGAMRVGGGAPGGLGVNQDGGR